MQLNLDLAYQRVGEYGRAQWLLAFVNSVARNAGTYLYYPFAYLVLEQQYLCKIDTSDSSYSLCSSEEICKMRGSNPSYTDYKVDTSYKYYLENWYSEMDLMCMSAASIGFMITMYFIGFTVGGLTYAIPDNWGRKFSLIFALILACIAQTVIIFVQSYWVRAAMFGLYGLSQIKNSVSYVWLSECTSRPYKTRAFTTINVIDSLPMVITCLYFLYVSKNWIHLSLFFCCLSYLALLLAFICPESPRWLLVKGRSAEAIEALNKIARMNKVAARIPANAIFVEDPTNFQKIETREGSVIVSRRETGNLPLDVIHETDEEQKEVSPLPPLTLTETSLICYREKI